MKITSIKEEEYHWVVSFVPNWFERLFGVRAKTRKYRDSGFMFPFGGGNSYIRDDGVKTANGDSVGEAIDKFRRKF